MKQPSWYQPVENFLQPMHWLVTLLLLVIIGVSVYMLVQKKNVLRTFWVTYVFMP